MIGCFDRYRGVVILITLHITPIILYFYTPPFCSGSTIVLPACLCALKSTVGSLFAGAARKAFCSGSTSVEPACLCALKSTEGSLFAGWLCHPEKKGREKGGVIKIGIMRYIE
jgi:hypothetical protein